MHIFYSDLHYVGNWPFSVEGVFPRMLGPRLPFWLGPQHLPPVVSCLVYILFRASIRRLAGRTGFHPLGRGGGGS